MANDIHTQPPWLVEVAIEPKSKADREVLDITLAKLAAEDPSFRVSTDQESGQTILKGMGELHLDTKLDILRRTYKVEANIGALQVAFRERMTQRVEVEYTHKKIFGPKGEFASVNFIVEPNEPGNGYEFESKIGDGAMKEYIPGIEKGLEGVLSAGVVAGFPVLDVQGPTGRRQVSRRRLLGAGIRNRIARRIPRSAAEGQVRSTRADHGGRSSDPGRLHRLDHRRPEFTARPDPESRRARQRQRRPCDGAAHANVRVRE